MPAGKDASVLRLWSGATALLVLGVLLLPTPAVSEDQAAQTVERYTLRYKFTPGESLRWKVVHRCRVRTTVSGTTKTVETVSTSEKVWRVRGVEPDGSATFEHLVEWVDMRHQLTGSRRGPLQQPHRRRAAPRLRVPGPVGRRAAVVGHPGRAGQGGEAKAVPGQGGGGRRGRNHRLSAQGADCGGIRVVGPAGHRVAASRRRRSARSRRGSVSPCWG